MWVHLTTKSANSKVGPIPVSTTENSSCPKECSLKDKDCYARFGNLGRHWLKVSDHKRGDNWFAFCERIKKFPVGQLFRHNQAGDLPQTKRGKINHLLCIALSRACRHIKGWTYTHYNPKDSKNAKIIAYMNSVPGMTINLSADTPTQADEYAKLGIAPVCVTLPTDSPLIGNRTPEGRTITICPAQTTDINCAECRLCQVRTRKTIVGFLAHGSGAKRLSRTLGTI